MSIQSDIQKLEPGAIVVLYELDMTEIGGDVMRFHGYPQQAPIYWQGNEYTAWAIEAEGFEITGEGQQPAPTVSVGNIGLDVDGNSIPGVISAMCIHFDDLLDAKVVRRRTLAQYLDAENFTDGNPDADPEEAMPDDVYYVEQKVSETSSVVQFELRSALDLSSEQLPNKQIIAGVCWWARSNGYRGPYCQYTGDAMFDKDGNPTSDPMLDECPGTVPACKKRFGENGVLNFGSYAAAGLIRT
jgi:lambda family phage minor tail protein L